MIPKSFQLGSQTRNLTQQRVMFDADLPSNDLSDDCKMNKSALRRLLARIVHFLPLSCSSSSSADNCAEASPVALELPASAAPQVAGPAMEESGQDIAATRKAVKQLNFGGCPEAKLAAAAEIRKYSSGDPRRKRLVAALGCVPPLVSLLVELMDDGNRKLVAETLLELAHGTFKNKALIVEAGLLSKLPRLMSSETNLPGNHHLAPLLLSLSSLVKAQFPIDPTHMLPFLLQILNSAACTEDTNLACIATLYNLSTKLENIKHIISSGAVHALLRLSTNKKTSLGTLSTLGNLMLSEAGKRAVEEDPTVPGALMEIMSWGDEPKCQELAAYVLMVLAHRSEAQRSKMAELGIVPLALEVALLGSPLAQKRALKMLQWFKHGGSGRGRGGGHSGPQAGEHSVPGGAAVERQLRECRRTVKRMVKQSLDKNMEVIIRRAHGSEDFSCFKSLASTSSSKSLPY